MASSLVDDARWDASLVELVPPGTAAVGIAAPVAPSVAEALVRSRPGCEARAIDPDRVASGLDRPSLPLVLVGGEALSRAADPVAFLSGLRGALAPSGCILLRVPNAQHHGRLAALLRGDVPYEPPGVVPRGFTYASAIRCLLDAGYAPALLRSTAEGSAAAMLELLQPALQRFGVDPGRARAYMTSLDYVFAGKPLDWDPPDPALAEEPITFAVCVNDEAVLAANLLASPCLRPGSPHELLAFRGVRSAAEGANAALDKARTRIVVLVHQDVYLPRGWAARFVAQWDLAEKQLGPLGAAGVYGVRHDPAAPRATSRSGHVVDRHSLLREPGALPARAETLDELLLAVPTASPLRFDPRLGFHFYGADIGLASLEASKAVAVLDAPCFHNSLFGEVFPPAFYESEAAFRAKWARRLPVSTSCKVVA
jgi:hypothetical protein